MAATLTARRESVRAISRTKTRGMRASAQRSPSTAQDHQTQAQCCLPKSVIHVHDHHLSTHALQISRLPSTRAPHSPGVWRVIEPRYPSLQLWSVLPEPQGDHLGLVTCRPLFPPDHHHIMPTYLPFPCPSPEPPCRQVPPCQEGKSTSERQLGEGEAAKSSPPIGASS